MNSGEHLKEEHQSGEDFVAGTVDEQIEWLASTKTPEPHQPAGERLIHDLVAMYREDAASMDRIWQQLSAQDAFDIANQRIEEAEQLREERNAGNVNNMLPLMVQRRRPLQQRLGIIAAAACIILLVGSLAVVLSLDRKSVV